MKSLSGSKTTRSLTITIPGRPLSLNKERTQHWSKAAEMKKWVRLAAKTMAIHEMGQRIIVPYFDQAVIEVYPWARDRRYRQDVGNCYPTCKSVIDGLVDAKVITDDDDRYLKALTFYPHQFGVDQMVLVVTEVIP